VLRFAWPEAELYGVYYVERKAEVQRLPYIGSPPKGYNRPVIGEPDASK
jgi:hypothetical protein